MKFNFQLDVLTNGKQDENNVPSIMHFLISPVYFIYL